MECFRCGEEQIEGNVFCTKCGARLSGPQFPATHSEEDPHAPVTVSPTAHEEEQRILNELKEALKGVEGPKETPPPTETIFGSANKKTWLVRGLFLLLLIAGINLLLIVRNRETQTPETTATSPTSSEQSPPSPAPNATPLVDESTRMTIGKMGGILEGISQFTSRKKSFPPTLIAINRFYAEPGILKDGWGQNLVYLVDLTNKTFVLSSAGPDGKRGTQDDLSVISEEATNWLKLNELVIGEWKSVNPNLYDQLANTTPTPTVVKKTDVAAKQEQEKKHAAEAKAQAEAEQERKRLAAARLEEEKQLEAKKREEEIRQAKAREEALREQLAAQKPDSVKDNFSQGLAQWDAPQTWEITQEKDLYGLKVQGLGFLKKGEKWDNYKVEFDIKVLKESAGWVIRAKNSQSFYLFKLSSDKAKAVPKNSLIRYIRSDDKYLSSLKLEDAPGAAGVTPLPFKVKNKEYYKVIVTLRGNTITHSIDGTQVDTWSDDTFNHGRFGFNASVIEAATIRNFLIEPLR